MQSKHPLWYNKDAKYISLNKIEVYFFYYVTIQK